MGGILLKSKLQEKISTKSVESTDYETGLPDETLTEV
jgi:hypothetical protein